MSIYEKVKNMNKEEFIDFVYVMYMKGQADERNGVDDIPWIVSRMADDPEEIIEEIRGEQL